MGSYHYDVNICHVIRCIANLLWKDLLYTQSFQIRHTWFSPLVLENPLILGTPTLGQPWVPSIASQAQKVFWVSCVHIVGPFSGVKLLGSGGNKDKRVVYQGDTLPKGRCGSWGTACHILSGKCTSHSPGNWGGQWRESGEGVGLGQGLQRSVCAL